MPGALPARRAGAALAGGLSELPVAFLAGTLGFAKAKHAQRWMKGQGAVIKAGALQIKESRAGLLALQQSTGPS